MTIPGSAFPLLLEEAGVTQYQIERSLRFNSSDSAFLSRTPASAGNRKKWTWAGWVKRSALSTRQMIFTAGTTISQTDFLSFEFDASDKLRVADGSIQYFLSASVYRDTSAWLHLVVTFDTDNATAGNRLLLYVNGASVPIGSYTAPSSGYIGQINNANTHYLGSYFGGLYFSGYLADVHFIDGQALDPSSFTEVSATTGQLIPKAYTGTYGTNGFHLPFSDNSTAAALGTDTSGNGNDWTINNIAVDSPITLPIVNFDGDGDYLTVTNNGDFDFGSGNFTLEFFVYPRNISRQERFLYLAGSNQEFLLGQSSGVVFFAAYDSSASNLGQPTTSTKLVLNDWNHVAVVRNGATVSIYLNGISSATANYSTNTIRSGETPLYIGHDPFTAGRNFTGALSNVRVVKGTALYTSNFTPPTAPLTNVTNTKLLCCQSSSSATAATVSPGAITAIGNVYATTLTDSQPSNDSLVDTPTNGSQTDTGVGGEVTGNYATWNPLDKGSVITLANGNLDASTTAAGWNSVRATIGVSSGKYYWEVTSNTTLSSSHTLMVGIGNSSMSVTSYIGSSVDGKGYYAFDGNKYPEVVSYGATYTLNDVIGVALDMDAGTLTFYKNGVSQGQSHSGLTGTWFPALSIYGTASTTLNTGARPFAYTAPSGFKALCDTNLPAPVVAKPSTVMDVKLYTGNGSTQTISGLGFSPDFVWIKGRSTAYWHRVYDTIRGATKPLYTNLTDAEATDITELTAFNSDGFDLGGSVGANNISDTYAAWCWDAGSSTVTNTAGSITSSVRANASAGFSIVGFDAGAGGQVTMGHGLGIAPSLIILKRRTAAESWYVWTQGFTTSEYLILNNTSAKLASTNLWGTSLPSSTLFGYNANSGTHIAYCFAPVAGYSSMSSFVANASSDGPFVFCNFRPRFLLVKNTTRVGPWMMLDTSRDPYNVSVNFLEANDADAEAASQPRIDFLSNGFKVRAGSGYTPNDVSGDVYVFAAFAESPFAYSRAR